MTKLRLLVLGGVAASLLATGCVLTSAQILVKFAFPPPNPLVVNVASGASSVSGLYIDLNTESDYADNKDKLKDIADLAVLGDVTNTGTGAIGVEVWLTKTNSGTLTADQVRAQGAQLWGPFNLAAGATKRIGWDESAGLFKAGKQVLIDEVKGDGQFSLYLIGPGTGAYQFQVKDGYLVLVIGAGL
ncbi:MAG: hypothetical protein A2W00_14065 [Candidatus Eisenbacteria bacterium RBG_16_71_46]|nr:MAG: hypothetical protein A2W00_14065 [Candidatus Eisenbacteria bacterium RBG_16_71_46]OGF21101.1 MAG: hypothetical protein A2V63_08860 [Candidatus Eisenbacteria bacterium RBG_19FT_COMBO_70_11]